MHQYELMLIVDPAMDERAVPSNLEKYLSVILNMGGTIEKTDIWGKRKLAYEIKKNSEGIYAVVDFTASSETKAELDRQLSINESILRTKILRADEHLSQLAEKAKRDLAKSNRLSKKV